MVYKRFYLVIIAYLSAIILMTSAFAFSLGKDLAYTIISLMILILLTVSFCIWLNRTNKKLAFFFSAVRNDETSLYFPEGVGFASEKKLNKSLNELNDKLKNAKINIELQEKFYKSIMENIRTGIISFYNNPGRTSDDQFSAVHRGHEPRLQGRPSTSARYGGWGRRLPCGP